MLNSKKILAIIPARGGSKRLPRKNVLPFKGKPLINWSIEAACNSKYVDEVLVSTDDIEIAEISSKAGANVPELRPIEYASDTSTTESVVFYILEKFCSNIDIIVILQPTSPLRMSCHIDEALELFLELDAFSIISVTPCEHPPLWANKLPENGSMKNFLGTGAMKRSQDLGEYYRLNGSIYIYDVRKLKQLGELAYTKDTYAYKMGNLYSIDIDSQFDFDMAEYFHDFL